MIEYIGFDGPAPFSVIIWQRNGENVSKTICYSKEEELEAISRFYTSSDYYSTYDKAVIYRENGSFEITEKQKEMV